MLLVDRLVALLGGRPAEAVVRGRFSTIEGLSGALGLLKESRLSSYEAFGPVPLTEVEHLMPKRGSFVRDVATIAGGFGAVGGIALAVWSSSIFGLVVGGKPPGALVPFIIVGFEFTILVACICLFLATGYGGRFVPVAPAEDHDPRYSEDLFGVHVYCAREDVAEARGVLERAGASEIDDRG
jgi:molybdopterin-containing oxidoreductase family membrane subunit